MTRSFLALALAFGAYGCTALDLWDAPDVAIEERPCRVDSDCDTVRFEVDPSLRNDPCLVAERSCAVVRGMCTVDLRARDSDRDGYRDTECAGVRTGFPPYQVDCDDADPRAFPDADLDGDGFVVVGCSTQGAPEDCDDTRATAFPGATVEACDGVVSTCVDTTPPARRSIEDADGDRYSPPDLDPDVCADVFAQDGTTLLSNHRTDCDDLDRNVYPGAPDVCDGRHDDCDASVGVGPDRGEDVDGDGYASPSSLSCDPNLPGGLPNSDCDDLDPKTYPGALESCDGLINDCTNRPIGVFERPSEDPDGDGFYAGNANCIDPIVNIECINAAFDRFATFCLPAGETQVQNSVASPSPLRVGDFLADGVDELVFARDDATSPCATADQIVMRYSTSPTSSPLAYSTVVCDTVADTVDLAIADVDGDAPLEIVSLHGDGTLVSFEVATNSTYTMTTKSPMGITVAGTGFAVGRISGVGTPVVVAVEGSSLGYRPLDTSGVAGTVVVVDASVAPVDGILLADLDGDSNADVVTYAHASPVVRVYPGVAGGSFGAAMPIDVDALVPGIGGVVDLRPGDVEGGGDGDVDLVVAGQNGLVVMARRGTGYAAIPVGISANGEPLAFGGIVADSVAVRDLDRDGRTEFAFASPARDSVGYVEEIGSNLFAQNVFVADLDGASSVAVGDFDLDYDVDIAAYSAGTQTVVRYTSTFVSNLSYGTRNLDRAFLASAVATGDVDGDGAFDIVGASGLSSGELTLWRARNRDLSQIEEIVVARAQPGETFTGVAIGDVSGDARPDFAVVAAGTGAVRYVRSRGDGTFESPQSLPTFDAAQVVVTADLDGDGTNEIVVASNGGSEGRLAAYRRNPDDGSFSRTILATGSAGCTDLAVGDLDRDGDLDVGVACGADGAFVVLNPGTPEGSWTEVALDLPGGAEVTTSIDVVDVDRDGDEDVVTFRADLAMVRIDLSVGGGALGPTPMLVNAAPESASGALVRGADVDRDGDVDLVLAGMVDGGAVRVLQAVSIAPPGYVLNPVFAPSGLRPTSMAVLDIDGDLDQDVAIAFAGTPPAVYGVRFGGTPWWSR